MDNVPLLFLQPRYISEPKVQSISDSNTLVTALRTPLINTLKYQPVPSSKDTSKSTVSNSFCGILQTNVSAEPILTVIFSSVIS